MSEADASEGQGQGAQGSEAQRVHLLVGELSREINVGNRGKTEVSGRTNIFLSRGQFCLVLNFCWLVFIDSVT